MPGQPTDENTIVDQFVAIVKAGVSGLNTCEAFAGQLEDAVKQLVRHPAVLVYIESIPFSEGDESGDLLEGEPVVSLLIGTRSLRAATERQKGAYDILKDCRDLINNKDVGIDGAVFRVTDQNLFDTQPGLSIYRQRYKGSNIYFT